MLYYLKRYFILLINIVIVLFASISCSKMNDLHDQYLKRGETIYVGRLDTAFMQAGRNRVLLHYVNGDPKVAKVKVYWRSRTDSVILDIPENSLEDTIHAFIDNLSEDGYTFELITTDKNLNYPSMPYEINANVYGDRFAASLQDRSLGLKEFVPSLGKLSLRWFRAPQYAIGNEVRYEEKASGTAKTAVIPHSVSDTTLTNVGGEVFYRTAFLPESGAIDTFFTKFRPVEPIINGIPLDKSKFMRWNPVGIPYSAYTTPDWYIENAWNGSITSGFANNSNEFTFDMGQLATLTQLVINTRSETTLIYNHAHPRRFQLWGSDSPDVTADFSGWTLLGEFESIKPSGSPQGTVTAADIQYAHVDGEKYQIVENTPPVRYIRFVCQETWGKVAGIQFMELTLLGNTE